MDLPSNDQFREAVRRDGWTPELKACFLLLLAEAGNVRLSARRVGLSAQSAYVQRRRDPIFARGWAAALVHAREHAERVLADRAIDGVEEEVWHRGELVGTRRRYDSRLLLAHLARLDRQTEAGDAAADAGRFDEIVAVVAGVDVPAELADDQDDLPMSREAHAEEAANAAERALKNKLPSARTYKAEHDRDARLAEAGDAAYAAAQADWQGWFDTVCATVDRLAECVARNSVVQDRVNPSTSPCASPLPPDRGLAAARAGIVHALAVRGRA